MQRVFVTTVIFVLCCAACATVEKAPTDARLLEAQKVFDEGKRLKEAGQHEKAVPLIERALELWETVYGGTHSEVASCLDLLGDTHRMQGSYVQAAPLLQRALAIRETVLGKNHPLVATSLHNLARLYQLQGLHAQAEPLYERAVAIWEAALGKNHPDAAHSLNNLAAIYSNQGRYAQAELLYARVLAIYEAALGEHHPTFAGSLHNLALLYHIQALYLRAEPLYERALAILEVAFGKHHPAVAQALHSLAFLYVDQGLYARAEPLNERALAIREAALGKKHPEVARSLDALATLYQKQGLYARAKPLYERALAILEATLGGNNPIFASSLNNLANLYQLQGLYAQAEPLYERALAIREAALGDNHPEVARSLNTFANLYAAQGLYTRAEPLYERAVVILEATLGGNHPDFAGSLHNLALLYAEQGLYARAEPLYERALAISEAALGRNHPFVATSLNNLAQFHLAQQHLLEALPLFTRGFTATEGYLRREVFGFSETRLASVLHLLRTDEERLYSLVRAHPDDARVRHLALSTALLRKGRSVEEIADTSRIIYRSLGQADRETFERLRTLRTQLSTLSHSGPGRLSPTDYQQRLKEIADQGDTLEADLARRSAPLRALSALPPPEEITAQVAKALPKDSVLIEFVAYKDSPLVPKPGSSSVQSPSESRYLALLLFPDGRTRALDLGPAAPIDRAALNLHGALARRSVACQSAAQQLHTLVFRPLVPLLGKTKRLFLSPDGQLALVPFAALHDSRQFLVDSFDITYLTSGKELLPRPDPLPPANSVVVIADPAFASPSVAPTSSAATTPALAERSAALERFFSTSRTLSDQSWLPLPGTRKEAEAIQRLLPQAQLLLGPTATKDALLKLATPGLLHIATHGFFLEDTSAQADTRALGSIGAIAAGPPQNLPDPLLRSGLVLAGARAPEAQPGSRHAEDSLVTALELAGLNLWGTQLVVLSACDTGRGDIKLGQGVYGLRRALVMAGAETLVTSLWKVNDDTTREFMEGYYRNLLAGQSRTAALRETMRAMRQKQPHPYFWAPFIAIGRDSPLQGITPSTLSVPSP